MGKIEISVILPVYNEETYIQEAINSILNQSFTDFELIIIDDASNDRTAEKILGYMDHRIVYKRNTSNLGNYSARNIGIQLARGKYIAVMDADDVAYSERLHEEYEFLKKHMEVLAVGCVCTINGQYLKRKIPTDFEDILVALLHNNCFIHSSLLIRAEVFQKIGGYNTEFIYAADYDLICRIALLGKIENLPKVLMMYRWHEGQISQKYAYEQRMYANEIRCKYQLDFIRKYAIPYKEKADYYTVSFPPMGELICLYIYSIYTGCSIYEKRADNLLEEVLNRIEKFDFYKTGNFLCYLCCGILYLLRNSMVEGCEDDILGELDKQLSVFYSNSDFKDLEKLNLDGWIHYLRMRVLSDKGVDSIKIANLNLLNHLLNINSDEISLF